MRARAQVQCYEDNRLLKIFSDVVRLLYDADIVGEDTILHWCAAHGVEASAQGARSWMEGSQEALLLH